MCGADDTSQVTTMSAMGSPPRVRSRPAGAPADPLDIGITSACAEQTSPWFDRLMVTRDHLRVCGADRTLPGTPRLSLGSPPRVRSRRDGRPGRVLVRGITSACAEQTRTPVTPTTRPRDHLRVCGADELKQSGTGTVTGSPPRVRSRRRDRRPHLREQRITSACAEQT